MSLRYRALRLARELASAGIGTPPPPDDRYYTITEGRPSGVGKPATGYSWCGEFASYVLMMSGLYDPNMINRTRVRGAWYPGMNIAMLDWGSDYYGAKLVGNDALRLVASCTGDNGGHVVVMVREGGGHVGFLDQSIDNTTYWSLDGNGLYGKTGRTLRNMGGLGRIAYVINLDTVEGRSPFYFDETREPPPQPATPLGWPHSMGRPTWPAPPPAIPASNDTPNPSAPVAPGSDDQLLEAVQQLFGALSTVSSPVRTPLGLTTADYQYCLSRAELDVLSRQPDSYFALPDIGVRK